MRSVLTSSPPSHTKRVSRTFVPSTYDRSTRRRPSGAIDHTPPTDTSRIAAKSDGLSKRGQQRKSIAPSFETSAAERQSPMTACASMGGDFIPRDRCRTRAHGRSVAMAMMRIGHVRMRVRERLVAMHMRVRLDDGTERRVVRVAVVLVVHVKMIVLHRLVHVQMLVALRDHPTDADRHERERAAVEERRAFGEEQ